METTAEKINAALVSGELVKPSDEGAELGGPSPQVGVRVSPKAGEEQDADGGPS